MQFLKVFTKSKEEPEISPIFQLPQFERVAQDPNTQILEAPKKSPNANGICELFSVVSDASTLISLLFWINVNSQKY
jgi:hypothetical protein